MFREAFPKPPVPAAAKTNAVYKGWNVKLNRLFFANGQRKRYLIPILILAHCLSPAGDPWRDATVSAEGLNVKSTPSQPIGFSDGFHCSDLSVRNAVVDSTVAAVQTQALASMKTWIAAWKPTKREEPATVQLASRQTVSDGVDVGVKPVNAWFRGAGTI